MLITFKSPAAGDTTYVGNIGERFLKMMGRSKNVPGAMMAADVPEALAMLRRELKRIEEQERAAAEALKERTSGESRAQDRTDERDRPEPQVSLAHRAHPLIQLLEKSAEAECEVIWE